MRLLLQLLAGRCLARRLQRCGYDTVFGSCQDDGHGIASARELARSEHSDSRWLRPFALALLKSSPEAAFAAATPRVALRHSRGVTRASKGSVQAASAEQLMCLEVMKPSTNVTRWPQPALAARRALRVACEAFLISVSLVRPALASGRKKAVVEKAALLSPELRVRIDALSAATRKAVAAVLSPELRAKIIAPAAAAKKAVVNHAALLSPELRVKIIALAAAAGVAVALRGFVTQLHRAPQNRTEEEDLAEASENVSRGPFEKGRPEGTMYATLKLAMLAPVDVPATLQIQKNGTEEVTVAMKGDMAMSDAVMEELQAARATSATVGLTTRAIAQLTERMRRTILVQLVDSAFEAKDGKDKFAKAAAALCRFAGNVQVVAEQLHVTAELGDLLYDGPLCPGDLEELYRRLVGLAQEVPEGVSFARAEQIAALLKIKLSRAQTLQRQAISKPMQEVKAQTVADRPRPNTQVKITAGKADSVTMDEVAASPTVDGVQISMRPTQREVVAKPMEDSSRSVENDEDEDQALSVLIRSLQQMIDLGDSVPPEQLEQVRQQMTNSMGMPIGEFLLNKESILESGAFPLKQGEKLFDCLEALFGDVQSETRSGWKFPWGSEKKTKKKTPDSK